MATYTIDDVARLAGTNVRNVRAYQQRGLLAPPRREGRAGVYTDAHLARLRLIGRLLDRGYSLANIAEMLQAFEKGQDVAELIGLEHAITSPWSHEAPALVSLEELAPFTGEEDAPALLAEATRLGIVKPEGAKLHVPSPRLLAVGAELVAAGIPMRKVLGHLVELRLDMERVARRFVQLVDDELFGAFGKHRLPPLREVPRLALAIQRLRPLALRVVELELVRALEEVIGEAYGERVAAIARTLESGEGSEGGAGGEGPPARAAPAARETGPGRRKGRATSRRARRGAR